MEEVTFTGGPAYDENGTMFVPYPSRIDYMGDPSAAVDDAWDELIEGKCENCVRKQKTSLMLTMYRPIYHYH